MTELKYKITDADIKTEDRKNSLEYFAVYSSIGLIGLAVGIVAVVLRQNTALTVLGIIMLVLAALLCAISLVLLLPHNPALKSVVPTSDDELRTVRLDDREISVYSESGEQLISYGYARFIGMKKRAGYIRLTVEKNCVLFIKCDSAEQLEKVYAFLLAKLGRKGGNINALTENKPAEAAQNSGNADKASEASSSDETLENEKSDEK